MLIRPSVGESVGFETTGSLNDARTGHTATLLQDGRVLVAGGDRSRSAEIYDPATGMWTTAPSMHTVRSGHTATLLSDGKVLVAGGDSLASAELYDPVGRLWSPTGSLVTARAYHTATLLSDGKVLVAGGTTIADTEIYDPASGTWAATGPLATDRSYHTATLLPNGKVLLAAGLYDHVFPYGYALSSTEIYDPAMGSWAATGDLVYARYLHTATLLPSGKILVAGGHTLWTDPYMVSVAELYDTTSGTWISTGGLATPRYSHTATLLSDGKVLVIAGFTSGSYLPTRSAEIYDPAGGIWTSAGSLVAYERTGHTATLLPDGRVLVAGGVTSNNDTLAEAEIYTEPPAAPTLLNISTRLHIEAGDNAMIGGFIITGIEPKTVIVRGIGPSLGIPGALADPVIEVHGASGELLATNDNWQDATTRQQIMDSGLAPTNDLESALWGVINPGSYTVVVRGNNGGTGLGLFEVYDLDSAAAARLANVSTRGLVQTGDDVFIGGFISGAGTEGGTASVLVRALGPSISGASALGDPTLELRDGSGTLIDSNDNWKVRSDGSSQQAEIEATTIPPTNDLESAILTTVGAGSYTAIVRGKNGTSGLGLVEVYRLP